MLKCYVKFTRRINRLKNSDKLFSGECHKNPSVNDDATLVQALALPAVIDNLIPSKMHIEI